MSRLESAKWIVASFTDAWIETMIGDIQKASIEIVASFTDAWIETRLEIRAANNCQRVASFTDAWIETTQVREIRKLAACRVLHGRVD